MCYFFNLQLNKYMKPYKTIAYSSEFTFSFTLMEKSSGKKMSRELSRFLQLLLFATLRFLTYRDI